MTTHRLPPVIPSDPPVTVRAAEIGANNLVDGPVFASCPGWLEASLETGQVRLDPDAHFTSDYAQVIVQTPDGDVIAEAGDTIHRDAEGNLTVEKWCKPDDEATI